MTSVGIYMSYMIQFSQSSHFGHGARSIKMTKCMVYVRTYLLIDLMSGGALTNSIHIAKRLVRL